MLTELLIQILSKYPGKKVSYIDINPSEYELTFQEKEGILYYEGSPIKDVIEAVELTDWNSNVEEESRPSLRRILFCIVEREDYIVIFA